MALAVVTLMSTDTSPV